MLLHIILLAIVLRTKCAHVFERSDFTGNIYTDDFVSQRNNVAIEIPLFQAFSHNTNAICSNLYGVNIDECDMCVSSTIQNDLLMAANKLPEHFDLELLPHDVSAYYFANAYYTFSQYRSATSVCVVGEYSPQALVAVALLSNFDVDSLIYFPNDSIHNGIAELIDYIKVETSIELSVVRSSLLEYLASTEKKCDVLHIRGGSLLQLTQIIDDMSVWVKVHGEADNTIQVIWEHEAEDSIVDETADVHRKNTHHNNLSLQQQCFSPTSLHAHDSRCYDLLSQEVPVSATSVDLESNSTNATVSWDVTGIWYYGTSKMKPEYVFTNDKVYCNSLFRDHAVYVDRPMIRVDIGHIVVGGASNSEGQTEMVQEEDTRCNSNMVTESTANTSNQRCEHIQHQLINANAVHIVFTFSDVYFLETAYGLQHVLHSIGYKNVYVMGEMNLTTIKNIKQQQLASTIIQIAFGPHKPTLFIRNYIIFHTENTWAVHIHQPHYAYIVRRALAVFVYSNTQIEFIRSLAESIPVYVLPMYSSSVYYSTQLAVDNVNSNKIIYTHKNQSNSRNRGNQYDIDSNNSSNDDIIIGNNYANQHSDVAFLLSKSDRRSHFINGISSLAAADNLTLLHQDMFALDVFNMYDLSTKEYVEIHSKVIVSIHNGAQSILETHRINHLLSLGKCIISERSTIDPYLDSLYEDAIVFATEDTFYALILEYARNDTKRHAIEKRALDKYRAIQNDSEVLQLAMFEILLQI